MTDNNIHDPLLADNNYELLPTDNIVYVVYKQGMFGQGIHGLDANLNVAKGMADKAASRDIDSYHSYDVYPVPLGRLPAQSADPMKDFGWMNIEPVYSITKDRVGQA